MATLLSDDASIQNRRKEHFEQLLNIDTHNDPTVLTQLLINNTEEQMPQFLQDEVRDAVNKMKKGKAPGIDGITTELLQGGGGETVVKAMHTIVTIRKTCQKTGQSRQSSQYIKEKDIHKTAKITKASASRAF